MGGLIHVGAWEGHEFVGSSRRLLLFEPQARPFQALMANLNGQVAVTLVNAAAGATPGRATIYRVNPDHSSSLIAPRRDGWFTRDGQEEVRVTTVDDEVAHFGLGGLFDELGIDTQGYELEVLKGATVTLRDMRRVECEIHDPTVYPTAATIEALDAFLSDAGFERVDMRYPAGNDPTAIYERSKP
jgi:FkbM family methyltransferase